MAPDGDGDVSLVYASWCSDIDSAPCRRNVRDLDPHILGSAHRYPCLGREEGEEAWFSAGGASRGIYAVPSLVLVLTMRGRTNLFIRKSSTLP